jgi:hypothetical protein
MLGSGMTACPSPAGPLHLQDGAVMGDVASFVAFRKIFTPRLLEKLDSSVMAHLIADLRLAIAD